MKKKAPYSQNPQSLSTVLEKENLRTQCVQQEKTSDFAEDADSRKIMMRESKDYDTSRKDTEQVHNDDEDRQGQGCERVKIAREFRLISQEDSESPNFSQEESLTRRPLFRRVATAELNMDSRRSSELFGENNGENNMDSISRQLRKGKAEKHGPLISSKKDNEEEEERSAKNLKKKKKEDSERALITPMAERGFWTRFACTAGLLCSATFAAWAIPKLTLVLNYIGALCSPITMFGAPAFMISQILNLSGNFYDESYNIEGIEGEAVLPDSEKERQKEAPDPTKRDDKINTDEKGNSPLISERDLENATKCEIAITHEISPDIEMGQPKKPSSVPNLLDSATRRVQSSNLRDSMQILRESESSCAASSTPDKSRQNLTSASEDKSTAEKIVGRGKLFSILLYVYFCFCMVGFVCLIMQDILDVTPPKSDSDPSAIRAAVTPFKRPRSRLRIFDDRTMKLVDPNLIEETNDKNSITSSKIASIIEEIEFWYKHAEAPSKRPKPYNYIPGESDEEVSRKYVEYYFSHPGKKLSQDNSESLASSNVNEKAAKAPGDEFAESEKDSESSHDGTALKKKNGGSQRKSDKLGPDKLEHAGRRKMSTKEVNWNKKWGGYIMNKQRTDMADRVKSIKIKNAKGEEVSLVMNRIGPKKKEPSHHALHSENEQSAVTR